MKSLKFLFGLILFVAIAATSCSDQSNLYYEDDLEIDFEDDQVGNGNTNTQTGESSEGAITLYKVTNGQLIKIKDFEVASNLQAFQADTEKHERMWELFARLVPTDQLQYFKEFEIMYGNHELLGYVAPLNDNDLSSWKMGLAIEAATGLETIDLQNDFVYTMIHEYAHVLTLNNTQVTVGMNNCPNFHTGEGCAKQNSYINRIFDLGWADIYDEFQNTNNPDNFYFKYEDRFVTDYAASNPGEDIAEVFTTFVVSDNAPTGNTIADQKVKLMYEYPELVELRDHMRMQPHVRAMKPGTWTKKKCGTKCSHFTKIAEGN